MRIFEQAAIVEAPFVDEALLWKIVTIILLFEIFIHVIVGLISSIVWFTLRGLSLEGWR